MRKSIVLPGLALIVVALTVAGSAGASRHAGTFKYCTDPTFPPMELANASGKITGFDVDMAQQLSLTWGANAVAVKTAFPGLIPALNSKRCDAVISGIFITPDRLKEAGAVAYMHSHRVIIVGRRQPEAHHEPGESQGPARRGAGRNEVRGVPQGAPDEDRLLAAELSRRHRRRRPGAARPRRRRADAGHLVRVSRPASIPGSSQSPTRSERLTRSACTTGRATPSESRSTTASACCAPTGKLKTLATKYKIPVGDVG